MAGGVGGMQQPEPQNWGHDVAGLLSGAGELVGGGKLGAILGGAGEAVGGISTAMEHTDQIDGGYMGNKFWGGVGDATIGGLRAGLGSWCPAAGAYIEGGVALLDGIGSIAGMINPDWNFDAGDAVGFAAHGVTDGVKYLAENGGEIVDSIGGALGDAGGAVADFAGGAVDSIGDTIGDIGGGISDAVGGVGDALGSLVPSGW
jgi:hypothetical protein